MLISLTAPGTFVWCRPAKSSVVALALVLEVAITTSEKKKISSLAKMSHLWKVYLVRNIL